MKAFLLGLARNRFAWVVLAVLVAAGVYFVVGRGGSDKLTYETQAVDRGSIETSVASSGSVTPLITVTVGSEVSGKLVDVLVDFNAKVKKGQLMARIDPSTFQSRVDSAHADLVVQKATVGQRQVDVDNSQVILDQSKRDLDRTKALYEKGLMSSNDMEKARNAQDQAQNNLKLAQAALANARSQVIKMQASLDQMQLDLSRTQIRAPVDGVVINRAVDPGQTVAAQMQAPTLFQVAQDLSQIKIETKVDEADIGSIKAGARATFTVDAYPDRTFNGSVAQVRINGTSSQNVVTYSVMVQANNPGLVLLPGMTANVKIITAERANVLRVASAALRFRPAGAPALPSADGGRGAQGGGPGGGGPPGGFGGGPPGGGPPGGFGGGGGGQQRSTTRPARQMVQMTPEVMKELGLSPDQQSKVTEAMKEVMQRTAQSSAGSGTSNPLGGGGGGPGGGGFRGFFGNNANDAQLMRQRMVNSLSNILTEEQLQKYLAMGAANAVRPGTVYVLNAKGAPEARTVRVGLSTDANTELLAGLNEGDKVIVRARSATAEKK